MAEAPGHLIAGQYRLVEEIGRGGFAVVWLARDERLHRDVAAKQMFIPSYVTENLDSERFERSMREARSAARLDHRGVVTVYDVVEQDGSPWIIMEFVRGPSLEQIVKSNGPLSTRRAAEIGLQVLEALQAAHAAGVIHRDVKPSNVLISGSRVVLTDFGIATIDGDTSITQAGFVMGAPGYMAPERARGDLAVPASDLWSLGATLYYVIEGRGPFPGSNANAVFHYILTEAPTPLSHPSPLGPIIEGLLRREPEDRLAADELAELLESVVEKGDLDVVATGHHPWVDEQRETTHPASNESIAGRLLSSLPSVLLPGRKRRRFVLVSIPLAALVLIAAVLAVRPSTGHPTPTPSIAGAAPNSLTKSRAGPHLLMTLPPLKGDVFALAFSPDGRALAVGGEDSEVRLWDMVERGPRGTLPGHEHTVFAATFSPDGRTLAVGGYDGKVRLWSTAAGSRIATLDAHKTGISSLAFGPGGKILASSANESVRLWDIATRKPLRTLTGEPESVFIATYSPRDETLATAGSQTVRLWRTATTARPVTLTRTATIVGAMTFSPDGRLLAMGDHAGRVRLWDVPGRRLLATLGSHEDRVNAVAFSPDGRTLASAGGEVVLLWDVATRARSAILTGHTDVVNAVAFRPDGRTLASGGDDATVRLWEVGVP